MIFISSYSCMHMFNPVTFFPFRLRNKKQILLQRWAVTGENKEQIIIIIIIMLKKQFRYNREIFGRRWGQEEFAPTLLPPRPQETNLLDTYNSPTMEERAVEGCRIQKLVTIEGLSCSPLSSSYNKEQKPQTSQTSDKCGHLRVEGARTHLLPITLRGDS